jgi:hypothetical protein
MSLHEAERAPRICYQPLECGDQASLCFLETWRKAVALCQLFGQMRWQQQNYKRDLSSRGLFNRWRGSRTFAGAGEISTATSPQSIEFPTRKVVLIVSVPSSVRTLFILLGYQFCPVYHFGPGASCDFALIFFYFRRKFILPIRWHLPRNKIK